MRSKYLTIYLGILVTVSFITLNCDNVTNSSGSSENEIAPNSGKSNGNNSAVSLSSCKDAGDTDLTAVYVNESVKDATIDFDNHNCDVAIYFDEDAPKNAVVRNTSIIQETGDSGESTGVWNNGGNITVSRSTFTSDFSGQFAAIRFDQGAKGKISSNKMNGTHRVAILARGAGTEVDINGNTITGSGAKTGSWAENGIQVDSAATAKVVNNEIVGHWWDGESYFASAALALYDATNSTVTNNTFRNNELAISLSGNNNKVTGNQTTSGIESQSSFNFKAYGVWITGKDNHLAGNSFSSEEGTGAVGIYIFPGTPDSKITGNRINGFDLPVYDDGDDSMIRGTPTPVQGI